MFLLHEFPKSEIPIKRISVQRISFTFNKNEVSIYGGFSGLARLLATPAHSFLVKYIGWTQSSRKTHGVLTTRTNTRLCSLISVTRNIPMLLF